MPTHSGIQHNLVKFKDFHGEMRVPLPTLHRLHLLNCKILGFLDLELRTEKGERDVYRRVPSLLVLADYFNLVP